LLCQHTAHLPDLIRLRLSALRLQVDHASGFRSPEEMMAPVDAHFKSKPLEKSAQVTEIPPGIAVGFAQAFEEFLPPGQGMYSAGSVLRSQQAEAG
jgi:hypothetical protein